MGVRQSGAAPRGRGRGGHGRGRPAAVPVASAKAAASSGGGESARSADTKGRAAQKLRENFRMLTADEVDLVLDPGSGLTLRARLEHDIDERKRGDMCTRS